MAAVSLNWRRFKSETYSAQTIARAYAFMLEEIKMSVPSKVLKSTESQYESLIKRFQTYAFGGAETEGSRAYSYRASRIHETDDALLELKRNVNSLEDLNQRLEFLLGEVRSAMPRR